MDENTENLLLDPLADAPFTAEQRMIWETVKSELIIAREKIEDLEKRIHILERQSPDDSFVQSVLTRPEFNREVARMLAFDERYGGTSSVLYFDIENLTEIIQTSGKSISDAMIRCLCDTLSNNIRNSDILGRLATDEFGVLLARCDNSFAWKKGEKLAAQLLHAFGAIHGLNPAPVISYGAYTFREKENVATGLRQAAECVTTASFED